MRAQSIRARLLAAAALWLSLALIAAWLAIGALLRGFVEDRFDAELSAAAETLIAGASLDGNAPTVTQTPDDPRFAMPLSGWFWQLSDGSGAPIARSASLLDLRLEAPPGGAGTVGAGTGPDGEGLRVMVRPFTLPEGDAPLTAVVTAPQAEIDAALSRIRQPLALSLAVLGAGLALASLAQVHWGLRALDRMGRDIRAIRSGAVESLPLPRESELRPLAVELNGLLDQNRTVLRRSREHLGNLAHSLKTPMAALANTLPADHPGQALIGRMDRQIGWHLRRARSAGVPRLLGQTSPVAEVIADILLVLRRPAEDRGLTVTVDCPPGVRFAGERQDLEEMVGNLLENAVKWAATRIEVSADLAAGSQGALLLTLRISDDGPGMADGDHARALSRGQRLDERGPPGAGLGLAIVADLAALHGGRLTLGNGPLGGLQARLVLPGA